MGDDDLIRRGDARRVMLAYASGYSAEQAETAIRALPAASSHPLASDARRALEADDVYGWINSLPAASAEDVRAGALKEAAEAISRGDEILAPEYPEWFVNRYKGLLAMIPGAKP